MEGRDKEYLGDGLYACHDGYNIWLSTERDGREHAVALEPEVIAALNDYVARLRTRYA